MKRAAPKVILVKWGTTPEQFREILTSTSGETFLECPKCHEHSGDYWAQCEGACPMPPSPVYTPNLEGKST